ncbi:hypothetical protein FGU71_10745 [Erythrobacter insulae]|uniref:Uncharacterized protein n=1 Tax=Erythrobacter insulae TaxID=2584124 RepID=A0A547PDS3_9SPHN|nr:hypothetical protein [Erythrobacter insulae]TRD12292.1 hypothetical protein FGU71_10745 [Erythrobacter insulae]
MLAALLLQLLHVRLLLKTLRPKLTPLRLPIVQLVAVPLKVAVQLKAVKLLVVKLKAATPKAAVQLKVAVPLLNKQTHTLHALA